MPCVLAVISVRPKAATRTSTDSTAPRFHVWRTQPARTCGLEPCGRPTEWLLVFPPVSALAITTQPHPHARQLAICPDCAQECFGIDVLRAALNVH